MNTQRLIDYVRQRKHAVEYHYRGMLGCDSYFELSLELEEMTIYIHNDNRLSVEHRGFFSTVTLDDNELYNELRDYMRNRIEKKVERL